MLNTQQGKNHLLNQRNNKQEVQNGSLFDIICDPLMAIGNHLINHPCFPAYKGNTFLNVSVHQQHKLLKFTSLARLPDDKLKKSVISESTIKP